MDPGNGSLVHQRSVGNTSVFDSAATEQGERESCAIGGGGRGITGVWVAHWSLVPLLPWAEEGLCLNWFPACVGKLRPIC